MKRFGKPRLNAVISGDWDTVISAREYREQLLDQKPFDEQMAEWHIYRIECKTTAELVAAYRVFREQLKLTCEFEASFISADGSACAEFQTGFDGDIQPRCSVGAEFPSVSVGNAVNQAIEILTKGME